MPSIKIYPPKQLPDKVLSEQKFAAWCTELEVRLGEDDDMARFMDDGPYNTWEAEESFPGRIRTHIAPDEAEILPKRKRQLKTFLSQVAKVVSENHYNTVMRQATSLQ